MSVSGAGALLEFDCANGRIDRPIVMDGGGFAIQGSYSSEHGGPRRDADASLTRARYAGRVSGNTMRLTVWIGRDKKPIGVFSLKRGDDTLLTKCR